MIAMRIQGEGVTAVLQAGVGLDMELATVAGRAVASLLREHLFALDRSRRNAMGGKKTHFFGQAARSVQKPQVSGGTASVAINHVGIAQRWLGGTIRAGVGTSTRSGGPTRYLAIPAQPESYGKTPAEFSDLEFVPASAEHPAMLVQALQTSLRRGKKGYRSTGERGGLAMFWLVRQVTQKADPSVMPAEDKMTDAATQAMSSLLARKLGAK